MIEKGTSFRALVVAALIAVGIFASNAAADPSVSVTCGAGSAVTVTVADFPGGDLSGTAGSVGFDLGQSFQPGSTVTFDLTGTSAGDAVTIFATSGSTTRTVGTGAVPQCNPTAKAECKPGKGTTTPYAAFKNQGDCVSFVATNGKNSAG